MRIPQKWSDLKIKQFIELRAALEMRDIESLDRNVLIVSALLDKPVEWVEENLSLVDLTNIIGQCTFTKELPPAKAAKRFFLGGKLWRMDLEMKNILPAQYIDISLLTKTDEDIIENMHKIMAIFCRPWYQRKYDSRKAEKYAEIFYKDMSSDFAYSSALFFYHLYTASLDATRTYLLKQAEELMKKVEAEQARLASNAHG